MRKAVDIVVKNSGLTQPRCYDLRKRFDPAKNSHSNPTGIKKNERHFYPSPGSRTDGIKQYFNFVSNRKPVPNLWSRNFLRFIDAMLLCSHSGMVASGLYVVFVDSSTVVQSVAIVTTCSYVSTLMGSGAQPPSCGVLQYSKFIDCRHRDPPFALLRLMFLWCLNFRYICDALFSSDVNPI
ncbi:hypothetical protein CRM22_000151 [Opisthorchis felineus]|uniref:Uncharacterized protein n=1 Tax=Opisthorchis felineus TaxID=147828 RepID=A0A4V3SHE9_OPIFE|nr:hypothetical protein CRM22_000151 [Opisthorchis felineus]